MHAARYASPPVSAFATPGSAAFVRPLRYCSYVDDRYFSPDGHFSPELGRLATRPVAQPPGAAERYVTPAHASSHADVRRRCQ